MHAMKKAPATVARNSASPYKPTVHGMARRSAQRRNRAAHNEVPGQMVPNGESAARAAPRVRTVQTLPGGMSRLGGVGWGGCAWCCSAYAFQQNAWQGRAGQVVGGECPAATRVHVVVWACNHRTCLTAQSIKGSQNAEVVWKVERSWYSGKASAARTTRQNSYGERQTVWQPEGLGTRRW